MSSQKSVTLVVHFEVKAGHLEEARELFAQHQSNGRNDQGNLEFRVFQDCDEPSRFTSVETWENQEAIEAHDATDHHDEFLAQLEKVQSCEKKVQKLQSLAEE